MDCDGPIIFIGYRSTMIGGQRKVLSFYQCLKLFNSFQLFGMKDVFLCLVIWWSDGFIGCISLKHVHWPTVKGIASSITHFAYFHLKFSLVSNNFRKWSLIDLWFAVSLECSSSFHLAFRKSVYSSWCVCKWVIRSPSVQSFPRDIAMSFPVLWQSKQMW